VDPLVWGTGRTWIPLLGVELGVSPSGSVAASSERCLRESSITGSRSYTIAYRGGIRDRSGIPMEPVTRDIICACLRGIHTLTRHSGVRGRFTTCHRVSTCIPWPSEMDNLDPVITASNRGCLLVVLVCILTWPWVSCFNTWSQPSYLRYVTRVSLGLSDGDSGSGWVYILR